MGSKNYKVAIVRYQQKWEHQNVLVSFLFQFNCLVLLQVDNYFVPIQIVLDTSTYFCTDPKHYGLDQK